MENLVTTAFKGRRVLVTGHTGFKGGWLSLWLRELGAEVTGYSLAPWTDRRSVFTTARLADHVRHVEGDVRDRDHLRRVWEDVRPDAVFHLAAQPLVIESYRLPIETITTNVIGTVDILETARAVGRPAALVMITSDKCYENHEWERGYREEDELGGADIYSGSKAAAEILISSYRRSFFQEMNIAVASVRAGNVIGGGDWSPYRIVPDAVQALEAGRPIGVRNPRAVRPWQHVLEPLSGYLLLGAKLLQRVDERQRLCSAWNFGPTIRNSRTVGELVDRVIECWGSGTWVDESSANMPHEATLLRLDIAKAGRDLGWAPRWDFDRAISATVEWYKALGRREPMADFCVQQIRDYQRSPLPQIAP